MPDARLQAKIAEERSRPQNLLDNTMVELGTSSTADANLFPSSVILIDCSYNCTNVQFVAETRDTSSHVTAPSTGSSQHCSLFAMQAAVTSGTHDKRNLGFWSLTASESPWVSLCETMSARIVFW